MCACELYFPFSFFYFFIIIYSVVSGNTFVVSGNTYVVSGNTYVVSGNTFVVSGNICVVFSNTIATCSSTPSIMDRCWLDNGPMERNEIRAVRSGFCRGFIELSPRFLAKKQTKGKVQRKVHNICEITCI